MRYLLSLFILLTLAPTILLGQASWTATSNRTTIGAEQNFKVNFTLKNGNGGNFKPPAFESAPAPPEPSPTAAAAESSAAAGSVTRRRRHYRYHTSAELKLIHSNARRSGGAEVDGILPTIIIIMSTDFGSLVWKSPSLHGRKSNPNPKFKVQSEHILSATSAQNFRFL